MSETKACPNCGGSGGFVVKDPKTGQEHIATCPQCQGTGQVPLGPS